MSHFRYFALSILISLVSCAKSSAQNVPKHTADSINQSVYDEYNRKLVEFEQRRLQDSARRATLENEIASLRSSDNARRNALQKRIDEINQDEIEGLKTKQAHLRELKSHIVGAPVLGFFGDTLFKIYAKSGMLSASDRAEAVTERIHDLGSILLFRTDSLKIVPYETTVDVVFRDQIIVSVTENDALINDRTQQQVAMAARDVIGKEVEHYQDESSFSTLAKETGLALLILIVLFFFIRYINKLFSFIVRRMELRQHRYLRGIRFGTYELFDVKRQLAFLISVIGVVKWVLVIILIYVSLPLLFGIFPWTKKLAGNLLSYITQPTIQILSSIYEYLPKLFTILVVLFFFRYIFKALRFLRSEIERGRLKIDGFYTDWAQPTYQIVRVLTFAFMVVVIFPYLPGSQSPVFQGVSVFLGFLFTFGSASSLSNIISGLVLTYMRLFKIGDRIKIGDVTGDVIEKSLLVTRIRTPKNEVVSIPNSSIMNNHTINFSTETEGVGLIIHSTVTIGYDVPWAQMHRALIEAAFRTEHVMREPKPFVLQTGLEDFYVSYQINAYIKLASSQSQIYSNLHQHILDVCAERGIEIMSPHYRAQRDGSASTIPSQEPGIIEP